MLRQLSFSTLLILAILLVGETSSTHPLYAHPLATQNKFTDEFAVDVSPLNVVASDSGDLWFTAPASNLIGRLVVTSTTDFQVQKFTVPTAASQPYDLAYKDGSVWFTEKAANRIARLNISTGVIEEFSIPTADSQPKGIAIAADGSIWFAESDSNKLGKLDPTSRIFQEYFYTTANAQMEDIAIESDGDVWLSSPTLGRAIFFSISRTQFFIVPTGVNSKPSGIAVDSHNELWIGIQQPSSVGRYAPGTLALWRWFPSPTASSAPTGITSFKIGNQTAIAYAEQSVNQVGLLILDVNSKEVIHLETSLPTSNGMPWGVTSDSQGSIWIAANGTNSIVRWNSPYFNSIYLPIIAR